MSPRPFHRLTLRMVLAYVSLFVIVSLLLAYTAYQARYIIVGPALDIYTTDLVSEERVVTIEGQVFNIVSLELNGRTIYTDEQGYFREALVLEEGYTLATIRAKDRYGRSTKASRSFVYKPPLTDNS